MCISRSFGISKSELDIKIQNGESINSVFLRYFFFKFNHFGILSAMLDVLFETSNFQYQIRIQRPQKLK